LLPAINVKRTVHILLLALVTVTASLAQDTRQSPEVYPGTIGLTAIASLPKSVKEASGLEMSGSPYLWTHNDDRFAVLYAFDTLGNLVKAIHLDYPNHGWEDLTRDQQGNFYVGSFGNNQNDRRNLAIYKIPDPESVKGHVINGEIISFNYADQHEFPPPESQRNFDADALVSIGDSLYIFTKNRTVPFTGYSKVYRLPQEPGKYTAVLHDSIFLGSGPMMQHWVTSADVSPDGQWLALLSHDCIWMIKDFQNHKFSSGKIFKIPLGDFSHKTGLCFSSPNKVFVVDELEFGILGGKLYAIDLSPFFRFSR